MKVLPSNDEGGCGVYKNFVLPGMACIATGKGMAILANRWDRRVDAIQKALKETSAYADPDLALQAVREEIA